MIPLHVDLDPVGAALIVWALVWGFVRVVREINN